MSKRLITNSILLEWVNQAEALLQGTDIQPIPPLMGFLVEGRIEEFRKKNFVRITSMNEKLNFLAKRHFEVDDNGDVQYHPPILGEDEKPLPNQERKPKTLLGMTMDGYQAELKEYLDKKIEIFI